LAGYAKRQELFSEVADRLEANAVILKDGKKRIAIVSLDLLYVGAEIRERLVKDLSDIFSESDVFVSATHNHYAPATDPSKPLLGRSDPGYIQFVADAISGLLRKIATGPYSQGRIVYKEKSSPDLTINRRRFGWSHSIPPRRAMCILPNPDGFKDNAIRLVELQSESGEPRAILWGYCCHPVGFPEPNVITAHYPGAIRRILREKYSPDMAVVFWQGFSGDVRSAVFSKRPDAVLSKNAVEHFVFKMLNGKEFGDFTRSEWNHWTSKLGDLVVNLSMDSTFKSLDVQLSARRITVPLGSIGFGGSGRNLSIHMLSIGMLRILGISAEPVSEYVPLLANSLKQCIFIPVGCIDDVVAYLPTDAMLDDGGYEVEGFVAYFGLRGSFEPGFQQAIEGRLRALVG